MHTNPFVDEFVASQAKNLLEKGVFRRFRAGDAIVRQGDEGERLFVVLNGVANVHKNTEQDAEVIAGVWKVCPSP